MFVAMNRFRVKDGQGEAFENIWRDRESKLAGVPGFMRFALLKGGCAGRVHFAQHVAGPRGVHCVDAERRTLRRGTARAR